ncbi:ATP synthase F1 subunit epsilon [Candidatus Roizmanbacteria bacterium RIFCSPLOWO2_12_FULL_40_12]|uniref:ATP synthase epsilon chain n=1 Tax=Candidatus Roizmanbacteria bacterium RIFCSPLOWO2_01_FULL_40_42 TaxID=1802066 RepID=A0A1F7J6Q5_9BACT|nr:MAG: ATP synthase F1 subunit epsilon [Candidatus Roizmanbacteria bacterium RIFCSPHIGHO2_01_FULL_40_98]OGK29176.1 MAG: ATP synthase F1 subunit epsilon [Candidatus Roizmanbacteria bacterium RIFCSPHIGHO2_02_FULL_40_53]OGK30697.1 MAG: ATP synthase F1 subunit epsilon [Candidatus Roizmanbacteria bacterium RIFCSPHIGHO2_12_41_18]OGK37212.1 MAG: ATP synthase F1 subunit epsilon [Candidatus Roizmanbacteria bacterium RIFCSPHIGHO2_12_FULL_40_130]OGK51286.1 MAG: ATP synthase F1 subunit epsilon [Candidatus
MKTLRLRIITPTQIVRDEEIVSATIDTAAGEITVLPRHTNLFSLLKEGVITIRKEKSQEDHLAIGGGYLETDGEHLNILVSRAYGQNEVDQQLTQKALDQAKKILTTSKDDQERHEANLLLRRSIIDLKLLKKRRQRVQ